MGQTTVSWQPVHAISLPASDKKKRKSMRDSKFTAVCVIEIARYMTSYLQNAARSRHAFIYIDIYKHRESECLDVVVGGG